MLRESRILGGSLIIFALVLAVRPSAAATNIILTSPSASATVSGTITIAATASSTAGIASVTFLADDVQLGSPVTGPGPVYLLSWNTRLLNDGVHTLRATAVDTSGNTATTSISIALLNVLAVGRRVQNTQSASVYDVPSLGGNILGSLAVGAVGTLGDGPITSQDGSSWWHVDYDSAASGWVASTFLQTLPSLSVPANVWIPIQPTFIGAPDGGQLYPQGWINKGAYDPATHRVVVADRWADPIRGFNSIFANALFSIDPVQNLFTVLKVDNWYAHVNADGSYTTTPLPANATDPTPPDRHPVALELVPEQNAVYTVNGVNSTSLPDPSILNKTWRFDLNTASWAVAADTSTPNYPPNNVSSVSGVIYDPPSHRLVYFVPSACGCNGTATYLFDPVANSWTAVTQDPSSASVNIAGAGLAYDSKRGLIVAYGGSNYVSVAPTNRLWSYSVATNHWTRLADGPVAAMAPGLAYDSKHDAIMGLVGNNTYFYNPSTGSWAQFPATLNRSITLPNWQSITYDPAYDLFVFEGGTWSNPLIALFRYDPSTSAPVTFDTNSPTVSITAPVSGATVSGNVSVTASAFDPVDAGSTDTVGIIGIQFQLDGANMGDPLAGTGPFTIGWNSLGTSNGVHTLTAVAYDEVGNTATTSIPVTVNNPLAGPVISGVAAASITSSGAAIFWMTDTPSDSQVAYGSSQAYGSSTPLGAALVSSHSVILSGLAGNTTYHYQVLSRDSLGRVSASADFTFITTGSPALPTLLRLTGSASETNGLTTNGTVVTPTVAPGGFSGTVVVTSGGAVTHAPVETGEGVAFDHCCNNTANAYYKFSGATVGNVFNSGQGQVTFTLQSRSSFAQRQTSAAAPRYAFDVRDGSGAHLFFFFTQVSGGRLVFSYRAASATTTGFYYVPAGTEEALFGAGVNLHVMLKWTESTVTLYLNNSLVQTGASTPATPSWTADSVFDLGAYEYQAFGGYSVSDDLLSEFTVNGPATVTMSVDRSVLIFSAVSTGAAFTAVTPPQTVRMSESGAAAIAWTAQSNQPWLEVSPTSGSGNATLTVSVHFVPGLSSQQNGTITLNLVGATHTPPAISVTLNAIQTGTSASPFGSFDTPTNGVTGVAGSIGVTGWALDDVGVTRVTICRDPSAGEIAPVDPNCAANAGIYIGDAVFIEGARADVQAANQTLPFNSRAGWGYLLLTNFLPGSGNGTFTLRAYAFDVDGHSTLLGAKTITCSNATSLAPFGAIDVPGQGAVVSGTIGNVGWVLSPGTARADPPGGGTVRVFVDGVDQGTPNPGLWNARPDLQALFPLSQFSGVNTALGVHSLDTTVLSNGVHTIFWLVTGTGGTGTSGIGSRFFSVLNGSEFVDPSSSQTTTVIAAGSNLEIPSAVSSRVVSGGTLDAEVMAAPLDVNTVQGRRGFDVDRALQTYTASSGRIDMQAEEMDRIELHLGRMTQDQYTGYLRSPSGLKPLPVGSTLDALTGIFTWAPGVGFYGPYDLTFVRWRDGNVVARQDVRITLNAKGSNRVGPQTIVDVPAVGTDVGKPFFVGGWAADLDSSVDSGVDTVHVWAYPIDESEKPLDPIFVGPAIYGGARPDVAAIYGDRFALSGYGIIVNGLPAGTYDIAVFAFSTVVHDFTPAKVVRVVVH